MNLKRFLLWLSVGIVLAGVLKECHGAEPEEPDFEALADSVFLAEGGDKTRFPYGVKSIDTGGDKAYARRITLNSLRHSWKRYLKAGNPGEFIPFFTARWCPVGAEDDPQGLNRNFIRNVTYHYRRLHGNQRRLLNDKPSGEGAGDQ